MTPLSEYYADTGPERVGFVLQDGTVVEVENVCHDPENGFEVNPRDLVDYEDDLWATWHTHPGSDANLSSDDYAGFLSWPYLYHYVIGKDDIRRFKVVNGQVLVDVE